MFEKRVVTTCVIIRYKSQSCSGMAVTESLCVIVSLLWNFRMYSCFMFYY